MLALLLLLAGLAATCSPASVRRGAVVRCSAHLSAPGQGRLLEKRAIARGHALVDDAPEPLAPGAEAVWAGVAVEDTRVLFTVELPSGERLTAASWFVVLPRDWPRVAVPDVLPPWSYGPDAMFGGAPPAMQPGDDPVPADGTLALLQTHLRVPRTAYVDEGPDARWFYVASPLEPLRQEVFVSRALEPGHPFLALQRGDVLHCGGPDMDDLRRQILEHEGALRSSRPSHFSETRRALEEQVDPQRELEALTAFLGDEPTLQDTLQERTRALLRRFKDEQRFTVDVRNPVRLRCRLRAR